MDELKSKILSNAVENLGSLPGVGKKTALRLALSMLKWPKQNIISFSNAFQSLANDIKQCQVCNNYCDYDVCDLCSDERRKPETICVVQDVRDLLAIEGTSSYKGLYHILGGLISPLEGVGPEKLHIDSLIKRLKENEVKEIIFALNSTVEGETTAFYIYNSIKDKVDICSTLAKGISFQNELEYTDQLTLGKSIENRTLFSH